MPRSKKKGKRAKRSASSSTASHARARARLAAELERERGKAKRLRAEVARLKKRKKNPRRPPGKWWESCLASVSAQRHAKDPAAVCGAVWWNKPAKERARIVREYERGTPLQRRKAVALAKAERNRHARGRRSPRARKSKAPKGGRKKNPGKRRLYALAYVEQKPGDKKPEIYEHRFKKPRPVLTFKNGGIQSRGGRYFTSGGWIYD